MPMLLSLIGYSLALFAAAPNPTGPEVLTFDELVYLADTNQPPEPLAEKLDKLLKTPFLNNQATLNSVQPHRPSVDGLGPVLRVAEWNIERGLNFDLIKLADRKSTRLNSS